MTNLVTDDFHRPNQSGWGTASDGTNVWAPQYEADAPSIESNLGVMTSSIGGFDAVMHCGSNTTIAIDIRAKIRIAAQNAGIVWAIKDNGSYYRLVDQGGTLFLQRADFFSFNTLDSTSLTGWSSADFWWFAATMDEDGNISASAWKDGDPEPGSPLLTATDATYADLARGFGVTSVGSGDGGKNYFASFQVTDGEAAGVDAIINEPGEASASDASALGVQAQAPGQASGTDASFLASRTSKAGLASAVDGSLLAAVHLAPGSAASSGSGSLACAHLVASQAAGLDQSRLVGAAVVLVPGQAVARDNSRINEPVALPEPNINFIVRSGHVNFIVPSGHIAFESRS